MSKQDNEPKEFSVDNYPYSPGLEVLSEEEQENIEKYCPIQEEAAAIRDEIQDLFAQDDALGFMQTLVKAKDFMKNHREFESVIFDGRNNGDFKYSSYEYMCAQYLKCHLYDPALKTIIDFSCFINLNRDTAIEISRIRSEGDVNTEIGILTAFEARFASIGREEKAATFRSKREELRAEISQNLPESKVLGKKRSAATLSGDSQEKEPEGR